MMGVHPIVCSMWVNLLDKSKILGFSRDEGGERYVKHFDGWQHLVVMLYAVIKRFDSLREISASMLSEVRKLAHLGISMMPRRSTLSDAVPHLKRLENKTNGHRIDDLEFLHPSGSLPNVR